MGAPGKLRVREQGQIREVEGRGGPFVWPKELQGAELEPFDKELYDLATKEREMEQERQDSGAAMLPPGDRKSIAEQARRLLEGKEKWRPGWMDFGGVREPRRNGGGKAVLPRSVAVVDHDGKS